MYHFLDASTSPYGHLFKRHILSVLASLVGKIYNSLSIFSPCKNAVLMSMEFRRHFFCAPINNTTRKISFQQVGESFKILSFDGSSKPLTTSLAFGIC